jgi:hypothetical protein
LPPEQAIDEGRQGWIEMDLQSDRCDEEKELDY